MPFDFERRQIDRIYEATSNIALKMRWVADDIDRAVARAKQNENTTESFRSTYIDLPAEVANLVAQGMANARLDSPARQLRELILAREASRTLDGKPLADRLRAFSAAHKGRTNVSDTIYEHIMMDGPDDARYEVHHVIDTGLLDSIANLLDPKGA